MKKFEGMLFCTDLDGTLYTSDKTVSRENLDAIEYFKSEGGLFTFITGRMPYFVRDIYEKVKPNAPIGCINGGGIYDFATDRYVWTSPLDHSILEMCRYAEENIPDLGVQVNTFEKIYFCRDNYAMEIFRQQTGMKYLPGRYEDVNEPIAKIVFGDVKEETFTRLAELLEAHPLYEKFDYIRSALILYEILPKGSSKGSVLPKLAEHLGIDPSRVIAVGDYNNDVTMLKTAGLGIAVANAVDEAKAAADLITVSNEEHAIAKIIYDIESGSIRI